MRRSLPRAARLLLPVLAVSALALFAIMGDEVHEGASWRIDRSILLAMRVPGDPETPLGPKWLEQAAIDVSALGGFTVVWWLSIAVVGFLIVNRHRVEAALLGGAFMGAAVLNAALKLIFHRARPDLVPHLASVSNASFPSGHAMISAAIYLTLGVVLAHTQPRREARIYLVAVAIIIVLAVGLSRLYLGVHWPSDVLAGWCVGSAWAMGFAILARRRNPSRGETDSALSPHPEVLGIAEPRTTSPGNTARDGISAP